MKRVFADAPAMRSNARSTSSSSAKPAPPLIVAITEWASANGDEITPTVFLSIETDELRHMANGYRTVVSIANDPAAQKYLNTDLNNAFWTQQRHRHRRAARGQGQGLCRCLRRGVRRAWLARCL
jgi:methane monooxygenase component A alpha chain